jgi:ubiquinone/menaquinone biosynthesis C-methylase UbiE
MTQPPNFDRVARPYRWLEYLALGKLLGRTRNRHLARVGQCRRALILGDGDGRFTARLLAACPEMRADAVDASVAMLRLLEARCAPDRARLTTHHADAREFLPRHAPDLVVTHFFLDCLTQAEVDALVSRIAAICEPGTLWLVSDFRIPSGPVGWVARAYVRMLYLAFRLLTGLRTTRLPDHGSALHCSGFTRIAEHRSLFGILTAELWQR